MHLSECTVSDRNTSPKFLHW